MSRWGRYFGLQKLCGELRSAPTKKFRVAISLRPLRSRRCDVGAGMKKRSVLSCFVESAGDRVEAGQGLVEGQSLQRWSM